MREFGCAHGSCRDWGWVRDCTKYLCTCTSPAFRHTCAPTKRTLFGRLMTMPSLSRRMVRIGVTDRMVPDTCARRRDCRGGVIACQ